MMRNGRKPHTKRGESVVIKGAVIPKPQMTLKSERLRIWTAHCNGETPEQIAKQLGFDVQAVRILIGRMQA